MVARRSFLIGIAVVVAGCGNPSDSSREGDQNTGNGATDARDDATESDTDDASGYHLRAAPVEAGDREPVLSTDEAAVARIEPLVDLLGSAVETFEVTYASLPPDDAEAFEELTADVQRYPAGNPPGYYIDHEGTVVSVSNTG